MLARFHSLNPGSRFLVGLLFSQVLCFWLAVTGAAAFLTAKEMLTTTSTRLIFVAWPLVQMVVIGLPLRTSLYVNRATVMTATVYGSLILIVINPHFTGSGFHAVLIAQAYYTGLALFVLRAEG